LIRRQPGRTTAGGIQVTRIGAGDRRVVFVHGVLDRGRAFARVAERLDGECHMLWYDRRGYGRSRELPGVPASASRHVDDLVEVLDGRPAVLVGHSLGGVAALGAAVRAPDLVQAVVVYETGIAWAPGWVNDGMAQIRGAVDPEDTALRIMLGDAYDRMGDGERSLQRIEARAFLEEEGSARRDAPFDVGRVFAPVVYGEGDDVVLSLVVEFLADRVERLEVVPIPGAPHHAHRSHPDEFAALVRIGLERSA
jgi:pimeloyl-ACP methyl ester carboxylesterase